MKCALAFSCMVLAACSGPYSRPHVAAKDEKPIPVKIARLSPEPIAEIITATGELLAEEQATIGVKAPGRLVKLHVDLGSKVQENQVLGEIDPTDYRLRIDQSEALLNQTRAKLGISSSASDEVVPEQTAIVREAEAVVKEARFISDTTMKLTSEGVLSKIDSEKAQVRRQGAEAAYQAAKEQVMQLRAELSERKAQLSLARQNLADCIIRAPFAGAVTRRQASLGEYLPVNAPIATLVRQHPLRIRTEIPERLATRIRAGQPIIVKIQGQEIDRTGRVVRMSPTIEALSRSLVVEGEMPNEKGTLRPGSFVEVQITVDPNARGIAIPRESIVSFAGADRVYIAKGGILEDRLVKTGRALNTDRVEILSGLEPGLDMVLKPDARLSKGAKVAVQ